MSLVALNWGLLQTQGRTGNYSLSLALLGRCAVRACCFIAILQGSYIYAGFGSRPDLLVHRQHFHTRTLSSREAKWVPKVAQQAQVGWKLSPHLLLLTVCPVGNSLSGFPGYLLALQIHMLWP